MIAKLALRVGRTDIDALIAECSAAELLELIVAADLGPELMAAVPRSPRSIDATLRAMLRGR